MKTRRDLSNDHKRARSSGAAANRNTTSTSVARAFAILGVLSTRGSNGLALMDTAGLLRMSKSTTHRYLITLERLGAVERDAQDRFHLGLKMIELAGLTLANSDLRKHAEVFLDELADRTKETVHLAVPSGIEVVYIAKADSALSIRMFSHIGARAPMYCTALGKAILAHSTAAKVNEVINAGLPLRTSHTITSRQALLDELDKVRAQGYAVDDEENELGVCCVGAPIFDYSIRVIGAISISGPLDRMARTRRPELGSIVQDAGLRLSKRMGYPR